MLFMLAFNLFFFSFFDCQNVNSVQIWFCILFHPLKKSLLIFPCLSGFINKLTGKKNQLTHLLWFNIHLSIDQPDTLKDLGFILCIALKCSGLLQTQEPKGEQYTEAALGHRYWLSGTVQLNQCRENNL